MSWQLLSLILLMFALGSGMLWYERSRPPSQIVALVAVLAALAVAGRIALAPVPNVVATTDIVIIAGFVLGPAPGFAVGALGGLVSNFWLGQGVWTPWQMLAWGMCGVGGGLLWKLTGGRVNRWWLAAFCGAAGLAFGAWMNLQTMVSFGGEMSLDRYLALEVRAIPFDVAHIAANFLFALIAGPAVIAALLRFRERFEWNHRKPTGSETAANGSKGLPLRGAGLVLLICGSLLVSLSGAAPERAEAAYMPQAKKAATWLAAQQNDDGGFSSAPGGTSSINITARAMFALAAVGVNPLDVTTNGSSPYSYLVANRNRIRQANDLALTILALRTVGKDPKKFEGRNLVKALRDRRGNGSFGNKVNVAAFAVLAFRSAGATADAQNALKWLYAVQNDDGGWGIGRGARSESDSTGAALMAITGKRAATRAIRYLDGVQATSGGFLSGTTVNSQSSGLVIQGLVAQGRNMNGLRRNGNSAADYLLARQADDGSIWYSRSSDQTRVWVTADVITALAGKPLPIAAPPREQKPAQPDSGGGSGPGGAGGDDWGTVPDTGTYLPPGSMAEPVPGNAPGTGSPTNPGGAPNYSDPGTASPNPITSPAPSETPEDTTIPLVPVAPSEAVLAASEAGPQPSPIVAILIALGVAGALSGGTILLVRRFRW